MFKCSSIKKDLGEGRELLTAFVTLATLPKLSYLGITLLLLFMTCDVVGYFGCSEHVFGIKERFNSDVDCVYSKAAINKFWLSYFYCFFY